MKITDPKLGDRYALYLSDYGSVVHSDQELTIGGTLLAFNEKIFVFGWKSNESHPLHDNKLSNAKLGQYPTIPNLSDYEFFTILSRLECNVKEKLAGSLITAKHSTGEFCSSCREFFPFSEPNNANGTLTCFNCRTYPHYR